MNSMSALHNTLLSYKTRALVKKAPTIRRSMNYKDARHIGILFSMQSEEEFDSIRAFEKKLQKEGKKVCVLCFLPEKTENFNFHYDIFTKKDFSVWGGMQTENVKTFAGQAFDILICLDRTSNLYIEYLMAASLAHFRIGPYEEKREPYFELMIQLHEGAELNELLNQIYHYTNEL